MLNALFAPIRGVIGFAVMLMGIVLLVAVVCCVGALIGVSIMGMIFGITLLFKGQYALGIICICGAYLASVLAHLVVKVTDNLGDYL